MKRQKKMQRVGITVDAKFLFDCRLQIDPDYLARLGAGSIPSLKVLQVRRLVMVLPTYESCPFKAKRHELAVADTNDHGRQSSRNKVVSFSLASLR